MSAPERNLGKLKPLHGLIWHLEVDNYSRKFLPGEIRQTATHRRILIHSQENGTGTSCFEDERTKFPNSTSDSHFIDIPGKSPVVGTDAIADREQFAQAEMAAGSVLLYTGSVLHSGGENRARQPRLGLNITYCLGWLRQESNQYLNHPPEVAAKFAPRLRALLGYTPHGSGDDLLGAFRGDCLAWVDTPPEPQWREERGMVATAADAKAQSGV